MLPPIRLLLVLVLGGALVGGVVGTSGCETLNPPLRNPIPLTRASIDRGSAIYAERCAVCHGESGRGDGPAAPGLNPRPADLRVHLAAGHSDAQLFDWISNGYPDSAMPAFRSDLRDEDRWNVLNYIRSAFTVAVQVPS
ncbi:MAG TPA: cytochrome c [Chloroflexota bacterium]